MAQQYHQNTQQIKTRKAILIFLKHVGPPVVLYVDNTEETYEELKQLMEKSSPASPKLIEKQGKGPVKSLSLLDTQIAGIAIQEENFV
ncbi:MAG: hypothetical protein PHX18_03805 [Candidatus Gastranaerophilales bacterium]|nr:hypothetical protein [Candidatus Gastranaerophilales bacterium]